MAFISKIDTDKLSSIHLHLKSDRQLILRKDNVITANSNGTYKCPHRKEEHEEAIHC